MLHPRALAPVLLSCASLAACGGGDDGGGAEREAPPARPAERTAPAPATTTATAPAEPPQEPTPAEPAPAPRSGECGTRAGLAVSVVSGDVACADALAAVAGFDLDGPKVQQQAGGFTCEAGEAATRPVVLTCVSGEGEVVARASGG